MGELGFPELTTEQIERLCSIAENAARKHVLSKVPQKNIERLDISIEADGAKPVNVTVEINLLLASKTEDVDVDSLVKEAVDLAHKATENFLRNIK